MNITHCRRSWLLLVLSILATQSLCGAPPPPQRLKGQITLTEPKVITTSQLTIEDGTTIVTNGFPLTITVAGDLIINGKWTIEAFDAKKRTSVPEAPKAQAERAAKTELDGTKGPNDGERGRSGLPGMPGEQGTPGAIGKDAGPIALVVMGKAAGKLTIVNDGLPGGPGGNGGKGGKGANGEQGGRGISAPLGLGAKAGPGWGGNGGKGGDGGSGGVGGKGGNGGKVELGVYGDVSGFKITSCSVEGGKPGDGGGGGAGGDGGTAGLGGRGNKGVHGREQERKGKDGASGEAGKKGDGGKRGDDGSQNFAKESFFQPDR